jgi:hypothetical protein
MTFAGVVFTQWMTSGREREARAREAKENRERQWAESS